MKTRVKIAQQTRWEMPLIVGSAIVLLLALSIGFNFLFQPNSLALEKGNTITVQGKVNHLKKSENGFGEMDLYLDQNENGYRDLEDSLIATTVIEMDGSYSFNFPFEPYKKWTDTLYLNSGMDDYEISSSGMIDYYSHDLDINENIVGLRFYSNHNASTKILNSELRLHAAELEKGFASVVIKQSLEGSIHQGSNSQLQTPENELGPWEMNIEYPIELFCPITYEQLDAEESQIILHLLPSQGLDDRDAIAFEENSKATRLILEMEKGFKSNHFILVPRHEKILPLVSADFEVTNSQETIEKDFKLKVETPEILNLHLVSKKSVNGIHWSCDFGAFNESEVTAKIIIKSREDDKIFHDSGSLSVYTATEGGYWFENDMLSTYNFLDVSIELFTAEGSDVIESEFLQIDQNLEIVNAFNAYPVPFMDKVTFSCDFNQPATLEVYTLNGTKMNQTEVVRGVSTNQLRTESWPAGVYLVKVKETNKCYKIIKN